MAWLKIRPKELAVMFWCIDVRYRGKGYFRKLVSYVEELALRRGFKEISLLCSPKKVELYKKANFKVVKENSVVHLVFMKKELA